MVGGQFPGGGDKPADDKGQDDSVTMLRAIAENLSQLVEATKTLNGGVVGPAVSVVGNIAVFGNTTGNLIADGGFPISTVAAMRTPLTAARTYYVRTDGSDSNTGLVDRAGGAFLTIQHAVDIVYGTLDLRGFDVDIQVRDGTFGRCVVPFPQVGKGSITLRGNSATPANVTLTATAIGEQNGVVDVSNFAVLRVRDFTLTCVTSGSGLNAASGGVIHIDQGIIFGACADYHMHSRNNSFIQAFGNYSITGAAKVHVRPGSLSEIRIGAITVTITGTPAFSNAFCQAYFAGVAALGGVTWSGAATGKRFEALGQAFITANGGLNDLPGNVAGTVATGGVYVGLVDYTTDAQVRAAAAGRFVMTRDKIESASALVALT